MQERDERLALGLFAELVAFEHGELLSHNFAEHYLGKQGAPSLLTFAVRAGDAVGCLLRGRFVHGKRHRAYAAMVDKSFVGGWKQF